MRTDGDEIHTDTEEVRAGATPNVTRWVLMFGLLAAIVLLTIIWVTGALVTGPSHSQNAEEGVRQAQQHSGGSDTDGIVGDQQTPAAPPASDPQNMRNENAGGQ